MRTIYNNEIPTYKFLRFLPIKMLMMLLSTLLSFSNSISLVAFCLFTLTTSMVAPSAERILACSWRSSRELGNCQIVTLSYFDVIQVAEAS